MYWIDLAGAPGSGKSTLVDEWWPPRCIVEDSEGMPREWQEFTACVERLKKAVRSHESYKACASMIVRSFRKMASVSRKPNDAVYIQTGLAQRGLGLGWRLSDPERVAEYYQFMPVSLGVVLLTADRKTIERRNVARGKDRSYMVPPMERPLQIAREVLNQRGVPLLVVNTEKSVDENRKEIVDFAKYVARDIEKPLRYTHKGALL